MKNQYIGDSKDYGKYRILNTFIETTGLTLGVNWYRTPDDKSEQGKTRLKLCTDPLYSLMFEFTTGKKLTIEDIEQSDLLPTGTSFYSAELCYLVNANNKSIRLKWHNDALSVTRDRDIVFLDPDNGLPPKNYTGTEKSKEKVFWNDGYKYVRFEEIQDYWEQGKSLIVFQHAQNSGILDRLENLNNRYDESVKYGEYYVRPQRTVLYQKKGEISPINQLAFLFFLKDSHLHKFDSQFLPMLTDSSKPWSSYFKLASD